MLQKCRKIPFGYPSLVNSRHLALALTISCSGSLFISLTFLSAHFNVAETMMDCYMQHGSVGTHPPKHPSMHVHITPTHTHSNHLSAFGGTSNFFIHMNLSRAKPHVSSNASRLAACSLSLLSDPCTTTPVTSGELHGRLRRRMPCHFVSYHPNLETEAIRETPQSHRR